MSDVQAGLEDLSARLAGDPLHVAFCVVYDIETGWKLWIVDRAGNAHAITNIESSDATDSDDDTDDDTRSLNLLPWSWSDMADADWYMTKLTQTIKIFGTDPSAAHDATLSAMKERSLRRFESVLERAARADQRPFECVCGRTFSSKGGRTRHINAASSSGHGATSQQHTP